MVVLKIIKVNKYYCPTHSLFSFSNTVNDPYLSGKKGGALASAIHSYIQHGDPSIKALVKHTLTLVTIHHTALIVGLL